MPTKTAADHGIAFAIFPPIAALAGIVEAIWDIDIPDRAAAGGIVASTLPSVAPILCFHGLAPTLCGDLPATANRQRGSGILTRALTLRPSGPMRSVMVRLRPAAAFRVMRAGMSDFTDSAIPLHDVFSPAFLSAIEDSVAGLSEAAARVAAVQTVLCRALRKSDPDPLVRQAEIWLQAEPGLAVATLASRLEVSERHLLRHFRAVVGTSPKQFARVIRLDRVISTARPARPDWARIAQSNGFTDQAHLINDFRAMTGSPPDAFFRSDAPAYRRLNALLAASRFHNTFVAAATA